jgi:hypothetical protein
MDDLAIGRRREGSTPDRTSSDSLTARFLSEPFGDLLSRPAVIVIQMDDHRGERQSLLAFMLVWTPLGHFVQTPEQSFEVVRHELAMLARKVVHAFVYGAKRARTTLLIEVAAKTLRATAGTGADELRQLLLFALEFRWHAFSYLPARWAVEDAIIVPPLILV